MKMEERSKVMAGTRYENAKRNLQHSLREKKDLMAARQRQSESIVMMVSEVEDKGYLMVLE